jgi:hypothetical protein
MTLSTKIPHFYLMEEIDITELVNNLRRPTSETR